MKQKDKNDILLDKLKMFTDTEHPSYDGDFHDDLKEAVMDCLEGIDDFSNLKTRMIERLQEEIKKHEEETSWKGNV